MAEEIPPAGRSRIEPLSALWRIFSAPQTLLVFMGFLALALALATWIPQTPPQAWTTAQPGLSAQGNQLVRTLGLYDLYGALWFRLLLALIGLALFVRTVDAVELAWRATSREDWSNDSFLPWLGHLPPVRFTSPLTPEDAQARIQGFFAQRRYRFSLLAGSPASSPVSRMVAARDLLALWARCMGYAALLLALLGLFVTEGWGWQSEGLQILPGETRSVGRGTPYAFRLDAFRMQLDDRAQLVGYESDITWLQGQQVIHQEAAAVGRPARLDGVALHQAGYVPAVHLQARQAGRPLILQGPGTDSGGSQEITMRFASAYDRPQVILPEIERFVALSFDPVCALGRPAVHFDLVDEDGTDSQRIGTLVEGGVVALDDLELEASLSYIPILRLDARPALRLAIAVAALAHLALALAWALPVRLVSLGLLPLPGGGVEVEVTSLAAARQQAWLDCEVQALQEALSDGA